MEDKASLLKYGEFFAKNGQLEKAFKAYSCAFGSSPVEKDRLFHLLNVLVKFQTVNYQEEIRQRKESLRRGSVDPFICVCCNSLFCQPITLVCGHTFCKGCFEEECTSAVGITCKRCDSVSSANFSSVNVLISSLIQKLLPNEYQTAAKILQGKKLHESGEPRKAISVFNDALQSSCPQNINGLCWRSDSFARLNLLDLALRDIDAALCLQPHLTRIIQRKARILARMGNFEESAMALVTCLLIEPTNPIYHEEIATDLSKLFSPLHKNALSNPHQKGEGNVPSVNAVLETGKKRWNSEGNTTMFFAVEKRDVTSGASETSTAVGQRSDTRRKLVADVKSVSGKEELQCKLCLDILLYPVTTACGHTFCRDCLKRTLDHRTDCPCCRSSMAYFLGAQGPAVNEALELAAEKYFSAEYKERKSCYETEITRLGRMGADSVTEIPMFVCTMAFPGIKCPLHIFEPRYRLMIRRCVESGSKCFGMCIPDEEKGFADVGTLLEICHVDTMADGRSIVYSVGGRRFRVLERGIKDGYNTAKVEWLEDEKEEDPGEIQELCQLNETCYCLAQLWFKQLSLEQQKCVVNAVGEMPELEQDPQATSNGPSWIWWALAALPLEYKPKQIILAMTTVEERLKGVKRFLLMLIKMQQKSVLKSRQSSNPPSVTVAQ